MKHYETAYARVDLRQHTNVSELTVDGYQIHDYDSYFRNYF